MLENPEFCPANVARDLATCGIFPTWHDAKRQRIHDIPDGWRDGKDGASVFASKNDAVDGIVQLVNGSAKLLDVDVELAAGDVTVFDDYIKEGYGVLNNDVVCALKLVAETEGIFLDPVYTGKAMVMLTDLIRKGYFRKDDNVVFFHTGGLPALFLHRDKLGKT